MLRYQRQGKNKPALGPHIKRTVIEGDRTTAFKGGSGGTRTSNRVNKDKWRETTQQAVAQQTSRCIQAKYWRYAKTKRPVDNLATSRYEFTRICEETATFHFLEMCLFKHTSCRSVRLRQWSKTNRNESRLKVVTVGFRKLLMFCFSCKTLYSLGDRALKTNSRLNFLLWKVSELHKKDPLIKDTCPTKSRIS